MGPEVNPRSTGTGPKGCYIGRTKCGQCGVLVQISRVVVTAKSNVQLCISVTASRETPRDVPMYLTGPLIAGSKAPAQAL